MIRRMGFCSLVVCSILASTAWAATDVICLETDAASGKPSGGFKGAKTQCGSGDVQVGRVISAEQRKVELFGETITLPAGAFFPPDQATK